MNVNKGGRPLKKKRPFPAAKKPQDVVVVGKEDYVEMKKTIELLSKSKFCSDLFLRLLFQIYYFKILLSTI